MQTPLYNGTVADPSFDLSGDWYGLGSIGGDGESRPVSGSLISDNTESQATTVLNGRPGASLTWALPANSSYVVINGTTATTSAYYTVTVSPSPPGGHESFTGNVLQGFTNPAELFMSPLDPNEIYNVTLSVRSDSAGVVGVHSVLTYSSEYSSDSPVSSSGGRAVSTPTSSSAESPTAVPAKSGGSSSVGPVVGGVVGGVGGLLLVALAVYLLLRRKKT